MSSWARITVVLVWAAAGCLPSPASAVNVTLHPSSFVDTSAADLGLDVVSSNPVSVPSVVSDLATDGGSGSATVVTVSHSGIEISFDHTRTGVLDALATSSGELFFAVDVAVDYTITGTYTASDADGRQTIQYVFLQEVGGPNLFLSYQESRVTPDESFTIGNATGDFFNQNLGSGIGTLVAGEFYRLIFLNGIQAAPTAASGPATASGSLTLTLTPEPSTALLLAAGLASLGARRRSRRRLGVAAPGLGMAASG